ncbi:TolC family protein [Corallococcus sp. H22C18031201]|nr:TolC family protein [Corallococcus sp. H22C18031201]
MQTGATPALASRIDSPRDLPAYVQADPKTQAALQGIEQAQGEAVTAGLLPNPSLAVTQSLLPFPGSPFDAQSHQGGPPQLDLQVSYPLDALLFGKRAAAQEAGRLGVDVARAEYDDVTRQRVQEALTAYYDVLQAAQLVELARSEVAQLERLEAVTERRVALGGAGAIEVDRARVARLAGSRRAVLAELARETALSRFRSRLGATGSTAQVEPSGNLEVVEAPPPPDLDTALRLAEAHRPALLVARRRSALARAELTREQRAAWPTLSVTAGYTRQFQQQAIGFPDVNAWGAGLEVSLPLLDRNQGAIARGRATVRQSELLLESTRVEARAEVEQALATYATARQVVLTLDAQALESAASANQRVERAYELGGRTLLEVLDAQAAYRDALREHISANAELLRALHQLHLLLGTEWPP